jgi:hypothetical protein
MLNSRNYVFWPMFFPNVNKIRPKAIVALNFPSMRLINFTLYTIFVLLKKLYLCENRQRQLVVVHRHG